MLTNLSLGAVYSFIRDLNVNELLCHRNNVLRGGKGVSLFLEGEVDESRKCTYRVEFKPFRATSTGRPIVFHDIFGFCTNFNIRVSNAWSFASTSYVRFMVTT
jgi:hypothetical protein